MEEQMNVKNFIMTVAVFLLSSYFTGMNAKEFKSSGERFHHETSFGHDGYKGPAYWGERIPLYKKYPDSDKVKLPKSDYNGITVEKAIDKRLSTRDFSGKQISLKELSRLLISGNGITHSSHGFNMRSAPSGGALYPIETYIIVWNVESLKNGLYHFQVADSSLELIKSGDFQKFCYKTTHEQEAAGAGVMAIILTSRFDRITKKYSDRGYRYAYIEAGAICENIYIQATSLGLGTVVIGAFNDDMLNEFLEIDGIKEAAILLMPVGRPLKK
jgi:SagB-type dehydrogenase family enzyme